VHWLSVRTGRFCRAAPAAGAAGAAGVLSMLVYIGAGFTQGGGPLAGRYSSPRPAPRRSPCAWPERRGQRSGRARSSTW
jgi:hypothetical protein